MTSLYEVLKAQKMGAAIAPDYFTALWAGATGGEQWEVLEYTGAVPVEITANGEPLLDYLISGNMNQSGTPTPQNPITPSECGERTGNLAQSVEQGGITNVGEKTAASNRIRVKADVSPNTTYTFASNKPISIISGFTGETFAHSIISPAGFPTQSTFTTGEDDTVVYVTLRNEDNTTIRPADLSGAMLNPGSTALPYVPYGYKLPFVSGDTTTNIYLSEPLRKIGEYADTVEADGTVTRRIQKIKLGDVDWINAEYDDTQMFRTSSQIIDKVYGTGGDTMLCSSYVVYNNRASLTGSDYGIAPYNATNTNYIVVHDKDYADVSDWKNAMKDAELWFALASPTTEQITVPEIPTVSGANVVDIDTTLKPSEVYIKYKGRSDS